MVVVMARQGLLNFRSFDFSRHYLMISYFEFFFRAKEDKLEFLDLMDRLEER